MAEPFEMIAKTFFGLEDVLAAELTAQGASDVRTGRRMAAFRGDTATMIRANIHCRTAVRILKPIVTFTATDEQALYRGLGLVDWSQHLAPGDSLAIDPVVHSSIFTNSLYAAQKAKDAIVDQFRAATGQRPSVDLADPTLRINLHIDQDRVTVYLDASGDSLHKRGYRAVTGEAPINEVLAAGILRLTGWDAQSPLSDFMCGSGTFVIEAALIARRIAPGLVRKRFGYMRWKDFSPELHEAEMAAAREQVLSSLPFTIQGSDLDPRMIDAARENARRAGVEREVRLLVENFDAVAPPAASGWLVTNPPYDERMKLAAIEAVYRRIGDALKQRWKGHTAFVFTGNPDAGSHIGLRPGGSTRLFNGPIECRLLRYALFAAEEGAGTAPVARTASDGGTDFGNRLARMAKHWHRWARRQGITCYRVYDRDVAEVPLSIDWYEGWIVIAEHTRPHGRTEFEHAGWLERMVALAAKTLEVPRERVTLIARRSTAEETRHKIRPQTVRAHEGDLEFEVHLGGGSEPGLPLDQRVLRTMLRGEAQGKRVLNLFGRAGTLSVAAAAGGASSIMTVDGSSAMVQWARRNLGRFGARHEVLCQDPLEFVRDLDPADVGRYELIVVEPPSFGGQRRAGIWNVQDGHAELLNRLLACMSPGGKICFVTSFRRLTFQLEQIRGATVREITRQTVPPDFRNKKVHRAWTLLRTADEPSSD